jgi:hypothetical protein
MQRKSVAFIEERRCLTDAGVSKVAVGAGSTASASKNMNYAN